MSGGKTGTGVAAGQRLHSLRFPDGVLWGAATSAHQVEGGNSLNDWWAAEQAGRLPFPSGEACRHFERYEEDFDLARSLGHNCHRLSIEWSRIEPAQDQWDEAALEHYSRVIDALVARDLTPVVTLHHFTNPLWFAERGGWTHPDSPGVFARFVDRVLARLGQRVPYWLTVNEPVVLASQGYIHAEWPPFLSNAWLKAYRVLRHLARAHVAAYDTIKARSPGARVGFAHNALLIEPCDPGRTRDRFACACRDWVYNRLFFRLIGRVPAEKLDFLGLNYYTRCSVRSVGLGLGAVLGRACKLEHHPEQGARSATGWEVYPRGLGAVLRRYAEFGPPLFVTENGLATDHDAERQAFLQAHLRELADAVVSGVPILGYLHWSLLDNFEWALGTRARFGLAAVDFETQERTVRESARAFATVCRDNRVEM